MLMSLVWTTLNHTKFVEYIETIINGWVSVTWRCICYVFLTVTCYHRNIPYLMHSFIPSVNFINHAEQLIKSPTRITMQSKQWRRQGGPWGGGGDHMPPQNWCAPPCAPPPKWDPFCASKYIKKYFKYIMLPTSAMKYDCIRIHALHRCVITNVVIQSTAIASLPATSFPGSYLRSSGEMTRCW